jgi:EAL domain-containing protein (putative c-di-GMP-specific phosphodiesterase class I)
MPDARDAIEILSALRRTGIAIAIDDFGTGYSSLGYLQTLPIDIIKIDRTFIAGVGQPFESALVRAVVEIADALSLRVVAEGVETEAEAEALVALGCQFAQGYLLGAPEPAETCRLTPHPPRVREPAPALGSHPLAVP